MATTKKILKKSVRKTTQTELAAPSFVRLFIVIIIAVLAGAGVSGVGGTLAYYNDTETSTGNAFTAGMLDFRLSSSAYTSLIGPEALGEKSTATVAYPEPGSLPMQYTVSATTSAPTIDPLCNVLTVEAKRNGITVYNGVFSGFAVATSTEFGTWEFRFDLPPLASIPHGATCSLGVLFSAWRADVATPQESGYTDTELFHFSFTARMVVLNEIFAHPGTGTAPKDREYVELYNNGSTPVDVAGWKISEIAGSAETFHTIVPSGATPSEMQPYDDASTIIPSHGYLVLEFGGASPHLNDGGDTVSLYDGATTLLDAHTYPNTAVGKAHVRYPDGIGFWVDPDPTPGGMNEVSIEDLQAAGFDEGTIALILELAALKNVSLLSSTENVVSPVSTADVMNQEQTIASSTETTTGTTTPEIAVATVAYASTTPEIASPAMQSDEEIATSTIDTAPVEGDTSTTTVTTQIDAVLMKETTGDTLSPVVTPPEQITEPVIVTPEPESIPVSGQALEPAPAVPVAPAPETAPEPEPAG